MSILDRISFCLVVAALAIRCCSAFEPEGARAAGPRSRGPNATWPKSLFAAPEDSGSPKCGIAGEGDITITCVYTVAARSDTNKQDSQRIVLDRAVLSLDPKSESHMLVNLTFTNDSSRQISERRTVYLAIDGEDDRNYVRRPLPSVDFSTLAPGESRTYSDHLHIGAFPAGRYTIHLWIPDPDPSFKFNAAHSLLLSNVGVGDPATGLNTLAQFTVAPWKQHK